MDQRAWILVVHTLLFASAVCLASLPPGTLFGWLLARTDLPGRRMGLGMAVATLFIPLYLQAAAWRTAFALLGWNALLLGEEPARWAGAMVVHTAAAIPWVVLVTATAFRLVEPQLEEQASLDASPRQVFARVTLPAASAGGGVAGLWVVIQVSGEMTVTDLFAVRTYAEEIYTQAMLGPGEIVLSLAPGTVLGAGLVLAGLALCRRLTRTERPISRRPPPVFALGPWRWPLAVLAAVLAGLLLGLPLASLVYKAGVVVGRTADGWSRHWSAVHALITAATSPLRYRWEFVWSLVIAVLAASAVTPLAAILAWIGAGAERASGAAQRAGGTLILATTALALAIPGPMIGLALIELLNRPGLVGLVYDQTVLAPWLAVSIRALPPALWVLWHSLRTFPRPILESAALDGVGPLAGLTRVVLPNRLPAVGLAWVVALAVALADLSASILVIPPGMITLSGRIFDLLHYGVEDRVAGICLAQILLFSGLSGLMAWLLNRTVNRPF